MPTTETQYGRIEPEKPEFEPRAIIVIPHRDKFH